ncbi:uncharacterized protein Bfra_012404 [Botrytis fragariae]|uniref:Uncharacterized protein n=1 Tax=Botrytis fragariae TaxID=1964551 RepID=A0A8H6AIQ3_9HELO|nr:uncharacterized protein Bfra_012404 [Botrytis fragariae]KAF5868493.1 hypothetical protein Bfra_012404 [Botrytis fragariae]
MSTIGTNSSSPRRLTFFTPPQSPKTSQPSTRRASRVITSSPRKRVSFPVFPGEIELPRRQTSWRQKLANVPTLWSEFSTAFRHRISMRRLIKVIILIYATVLIFRVIDIRISLGENPMYEREEEYIHGGKGDSLRKKEQSMYEREEENVHERKQDFQREKKQPTHKHDNRDAFHISHQFEPYELVSPLYDLANLDISPQLDVLKDAYSDSRYGLNRLRDGLPELSKDSPGLSTKIRSFREQVWSVSEAIGGFSKFIDVYIGTFQRETDHLREELAKVKPGDEIANLNLEDCRKVGVVWITLHKRLKLKIRNIWRMKDVFSNIIDSVIRDRKNLEKALKEAECGMTKEAKKQGWDNFDFPSAYQLLERFSRGRTKDKNWGGYEETIKELIIYIDVSLKDANAQIENLMADFQRVLSAGENKADVDSIDFPTIFNQMEALNITFEKYERVKVLIERMKEKSMKELRARAHDSKERNRYYNYVASQQKGRLDKHIIAPRDRKKEEFLQNLKERRVKQSQKGG